MDATMYLFLNRGAQMSTGKASAQIAHAAVEAYRDGKKAEIDNETFKLRQAWLRSGHYKKLVMEAQDETHLLVIKEYLEERGLRVYPIIDEGLTEVRAHTLCALGVQIVDKDDPEIAGIFSTFKLYRDKPQGIVVIETKGVGWKTLAEAKRLANDGDLEGAQAALRAEAERKKARPRRGFFRRK